MKVLFYSGLVSLIFGLLFVFAPKFIDKLNQIGNIVITTDEKTIAHRYVTGAFLIVISIVLLYYSRRF